MAKRRRKQGKTLLKPRELPGKFRRVLASVRTYVFNGKRRYDADDICIMLLTLIEAIEDVVHRVGCIGQWVTAVAFLNAEVEAIQKHRPSINTIRTVIYASQLIQLPAGLEQTAICWSKAQRSI